MQHSYNSYISHFHSCMAVRIGADMIHRIIVLTCFAICFFGLIYAVLCGYEPFYKFALVALCCALGICTCFVW